MNLKSVLYWIIGILILIVVGRIFIYFLPIIIVILIIYMIVKKDKPKIHRPEEKDSKFDPNKEIRIEKKDFDIKDDQQ